MKRILCTILVLLMLPVTYAFAEKTDKVEAFTFYGLYVKRVMEYQSLYGIDYDFHVEGMNFPLQFGKEIEVGTAAAQLTINSDDFRVKEALIEVFNSGSSDDRNNFLLVSACAAMSALEYTETEERVMKLSYQVGNGGAPSAVQKMTALFTAEIIGKINEAASKRSSDDILIYSDNYDYYISYYAPSFSSVEVVYLKAKAK